MQDIVFYVAAKETHGIVRDSANANPLSAPDLVIGVSVCLKIRLFAACNVATPYPVASFVGVANWTWHMGADFDRDVPSLLVADAEDISVRTVTDTVDGQTMSFTEFSIPISDMDTQELSAWIGNARKRSGLVGELIGYDSEENAVFVLQVDDFTIWNRVDGLAEPTTIDREVPTRSETLQMIQTAVSSSAETKQDKLTSANAGTNISINENGVISNIYSLPSATNSVKGGVSLATDAETIAGSNAAKAITPASFKAALTGSDQIVEHSALKAFRQIDNLGSASTVSLASGRAYKLVATSGSHFLTVSDVPAGKYGMDAHLELFVGATALVHTSAPLILMDALVPNVVNDCVIKFRDGTARMFVEDHAYGYVVTVAGGTEGTQLEGSLYYGLTGSTQSYVVFANSLNGQTVTFPEGTTVNRIVNVVGNGYTQTILSGGVSCTSKTTFSNLGMNGVSVLGGTATLGDVFIPAGGTVGVNGGNLAIEKVTGSGGTIDLGGTNIDMYGGSVSGVTVASGSKSGNNGGGLFYAANNTVFALSGCHLFGGIAAAGGAISLRYGRGANVTSCSFDGNTATKGKAIALSESSFVNLSGCSFGSGQDICFRGGTPSVNLYGTNMIDYINANGGSGTVTLTSGAILDLTGNTNATPVNPGGGVTFAEGGATIYPSAGQASAYMLGGMTVPQIGNTNVVNLNSTNVVISSGATAYASGCTFSGGSAATRGGAFNVSRGALILSSCSFVGNTAGVAGKAISIDQNAVVLCLNCEFDSDQDIFAWNNGKLVLTGGAQKIQLNASTNVLELFGNVTLNKVVGQNGTSTGGGSVVISSGASINLTSSIAPGGGITFAEGGATVYPSAGSASAYTLGGMTVPQIGNTNVVNLSGTNVTVSSGGTAYASGCIFSGGSANFGGTFYVDGGNLVLSGVDLIETKATSRGGAIAVLSGGNAELTDCTISGARASVSGKGMYVTNGGIQLTNCTIEDTNGDSIMLNGNASADISGCTITSSIRFGNNNSNTLSFAGNNTIELVYATGGVSGYITISSGAIVDLTGNTNSTPIVPGGGILISSGGISIIDSAGSTHEFQDLAITGSTINNLGQILGATVSIPAAGAGVGPWIVSTTLGSSAVSATAEAQELVIEGGLVSIQEL